MISYQNELCAKVLFEMNLSDEIISQSEKLLFDECDLSQTLSSPVVSKNERYKIIDKLFDKKIAPFVKVMCDNGQGNELKNILLAYKNLKRKSLDIVTATVTSAYPLSENERKKFCLSLKTSLGVQDVALDFVTDKTLLGGYTLQIEDKLYDKSIRGAINSLGKKLSLNSKLHAD